MKMNTLEGKVVAIIGATGGIGDPLAEKSVKAGAKVLLGARRFPELQALRERIDPTGKNSIALATDASITGQVINLLNAGFNRFKRVDIVIVTVGTWRQTYYNTDLEEVASTGRILTDSIIIPSWNAIFEAHRFFSNTYQVGIIFNMSSWVVTKKEGVLSGNILYRAAKRAVESVVESLQEVGDMVKIVNLRPATVDTPINRKTHPGVPTDKWGLAVQPKTIFDWINEHSNDPNIPEDVYFPSDLKL